MTTRPRLGLWLADAVEAVVSHAVTSALALALLIIVILEATR